MIKALLIITTLGVLATSCSAIEPITPASVQYPVVIDHTPVDKELLPCV